LINKARDISLILQIEDNSADSFISLKAIKHNPNIESRYLLAQTLIEAAAMRSEEPDLILLDLYLPDSRGPETFVKVKELFPNSEIIVLSGVQNIDLESMITDHPDLKYIEKSSLTLNDLVPCIFDRLKINQSDELMSTRTRH
jgi:response regulator of citrate/malate metabolism